MLLYGKMSHIEIFKYFYTTNAHLQRERIIRTCRMIANETTLNQ